MKLKVCGVNDAAFAARAAALGADYIGLIFAEKSPRRVTPAGARLILAAIAGTGAVPVGVFTARPIAEIIDTARALGLSHVQLHYRASAADVAAARAAHLTVWTLAGGAETADALLFDSTHGDGETEIRRGAWLTVLAGGISEKNLASAVRLTPDVIDVSGSLESANGVKSIALLERFIAAWRALQGAAI